jgi:hypothetical protein
MASVPSSHRQRTSFFPTPLIGDVLFSERVVCQTKVIPAYGTAHPNSAKWPNHKLVFVKERPEPESVDTFDFYYAADRATQDLYNFSHTEADIGGTRFDAVARTYVTLRSAFTPNTPAMGATMPNSPTGLFPGSHVLAEKRQTRIGDQELDSLYVAEIHVYVKRVSISEVKMNDETGRVKKSVTNLYYRGEIVTGSTPVEDLAANPGNAYWGQQSDGVFRELSQLSENWFAIIESNVLPDNSINSAANPAKARIINRVTPLGTDIYFTEVGAMPSPTPAYGSAHYDTTNWPNHKLSFISPADSSGLLYKFHYVADRPNQDLYNFSFAKADIGGTRFDSVERTYVTLRSAFTPQSPTMGATMPNVPVDLFVGSYVLAEKRQTRIGEDSLDSLYVAEVHTYVKRCTIKQLGVDSFNGKVLTSTSTLYYGTEIVTGATTAATLFADPANAYWGLQTDGTQKSGRQLSCEWYEISSEVIVAGTFVDGAVTARTYNTTLSYYWPPVLNDINVSVWERRDGGVERFLNPVYLREGYNGECRATVVDAFHVAAPTITTPDVMLPLPINVQNPYFSAKLGPTLHTLKYLSFTNGTEDPIFKYTIDEYTFAATDPTDWPTSVTIKNVFPFRGGYLLSTITIFQPDT